MHELFEQHTDAISRAMTIRMTERRLLALFSEGKLFGTVHTCIGQEFIGVAVAQGLTDADTLYSNHRCHGHFLAYRKNLPGLIGEIMGKQIGVCAGRGGSQHLQLDGFFSNGIQGGIAPVAAGQAMAHKLKKNNGIAVVFIGDGTLGEGALYETLNLASKWGLPLLIVCENNRYAQSTSQTETLAGSITARAEAFGMATAHSNSWDVPGLLTSMSKSVDKVRSESVPVFHQVDTYRLMAHSKGDDDRAQEEVDSYWQRDVLQQLGEALADDPKWKQMVEDIEAEIEEAVQQAEASPFDTFTPPTSAPVTTAYRPLTFERDRLVALVREGLNQAMAAHDDLMIIGEDIESPYGGAFKCTQGLSTAFPGRVRNMPISESTIVGMANGMSLMGVKCVGEIMFGDFMTLATDQWINHAAKFRWMYNDQVKLPMVIRTPMGGKRGYASTHSQSIEKHFLGLPGTQVLAIHHRYCPKQLYKDLFDTIEDPTLVIENKMLYGQYADPTPLPGYQLTCTDETFPVVRMQPEIPADVTMVAVGGMCMDAEKAVIELFEEEEIATDLFLPTKLYPFSIAPLVESLKQTKRLVVVEEGQGFVSLSSEIIAQVAEQLPGVGVVCRRVTSAASPIPASRPLEEQCLPGADDIVKGVKETIGELVH